MRRGRRAALSTFTLGPLDFLDDQPPRLIEGGQPGLALYVRIALIRP
jgi:hypothetical protein